MQDACSGAWHKQELFLATPSEIHCILIASADESSEPYIEVVILIPLHVRQLIRVPLCTLSWLALAYLWHFPDVMCCPDILSISKVVQNQGTCPQA